MSKVFKADDEALEVEFRGKKYEVRLPSHSEIESYQKRLKELPEEQASSALFEFLDQLGLPAEEAKQITARKLVALINVLNEVEKKS